MSELKFLCPHCRQRLAIDDAFAGQEVTCPACTEKMVAPEEIPTASTVNASGADAVRKRARHPLYPVPKSEVFWTEPEWERHKARLDFMPRFGANAHVVWFWVFVLGLFWLLSWVWSTAVTGGGDPTVGLILAVACSAGMGFSLSRACGNEGLMHLATGAVLSLGGLFVVFVVLMAVGCKELFEIGRSINP